MRSMRYFALMLIVMMQFNILQGPAAAYTVENRYGLTYEPCDASPDTTFPPEGSNAPTAGNDCFMLYQGQRESPQIYMNDYDPLNEYKICSVTSVPKESGKIIKQEGILIEVASDATDSFTFEYTMCNDEGSDTAEVKVYPLKVYPVKVKKLKNKMFKVTNPNTRDSGFVNFTWGDIDGYTCGQGNKTIRPGASKKLKPYCKVMEWYATIGYGEAPAGKGTLKY